MRVQTNIRKIGVTLYLRIPPWFAQMRALADGDVAFWKPKFLDRTDRRCPIPPCDEDAGAAPRPFAKYFRDPQMAAGALNQPVR
jgi:hypothetical protein